jgi:3-carboxy-cis,cis-muconate cycloisomerase
MASSAEMPAIFEDQALIGHALAFEVALARAEAECGVIPLKAADAIAKAASTIRLDMGELANAAARGGAFAIPLIRELGSSIAAIDKEAAGYVHFGATSQDVADTALVLQLRAASTVLLRDLKRLAGSLAELTRRHRDTLMLARTLMQPALPTSFALKSASWLMAIEDGMLRLEREREAALMLQFGGAAGTLAALGDKAMVVARRLAALLELPVPPLPWHTRRDGVVGLAAAIGIVTGSLGKIARDISLLSQAELGEAAEPAGQGRGGSSTLPHKRNPVASLAALAAAMRAPGLVSTMLAAMVQEQERALGGWQAEAPTLSSLCEAAHGALAAIVEAIEGLVVDPAAMRRNLDRLAGLVLAERLMLTLAPSMGRGEAHRLVEQLSREAVASKRHLRELAQGNAIVSKHLPPDEIARLFDPAGYLGAASEFIDNALAVHHFARERRGS